MEYCEVDFEISSPAAIWQDACDLLAAMAGDIGFEAFEETGKGIKGYVQKHLFDLRKTDRMIADFPMEDVSVSYTVTDAERKDWNEEWERGGFEPIDIDGICCIHDGKHIPRRSYKVTVEINARLAFGTGLHETTRLMLSLLASTEIEGKVVADCGCGTGILGITALKCGAKRVFGYDIDEWSVDNARHNAAINGVADKYTTMLGNASVLLCHENEFDIALANINRNVLMADMGIYANALKAGGTLALSGFYIEDIPLVKRKAADMKLIVEMERHDNDWAMLAFKK